MKYSLKKAVSLLLCAAMLFGIFGIVGSGATVTPVIYVADIVNSPIYSNPNKASAEAVFFPAEEEMQSAFLFIIAGFMCYAVAGEEKTGKDLIIRGINSLTKDAACNEYGETQDGLGVNDYKYPLSYYKDDPAVVTQLMMALDEANGAVGLEHTYLFTYDWRLDPIENAGKLKDFIAHVKSREGAKKVALLCAGNGGVVGNAYLYTYAATAANDVASCVFLNSPLTGHNLVGDVMSGNLTHVTDESESILDTLVQVTKIERANAMVRYINDDPNGMIKQLFDDVFGSDELISQLGFTIIWIVNAALGGQNVWSDMAKSYSDFISANKDALYTPYLKAFLCNAPGLWALVPQEYFDDAMFFMFGNEEIPAKLEKKINDFRPVLAATKTTLQNAKNNGINVCLVAGYNMQVLPVTGNIDQHSDSMLLTKYASAGATAAKHGSSDMLTQAVKDGHEHLSPDAQIDASTGALPEHTWYIRNLPNMRYECESAADFVTWLLMSDHQRTIWEELRYPQYMAYSRNKNIISALDNGTTVYYYGDANVDGFVDAGDARLALRVSVGLESITTEIGFILADVDCNGEITAGDARQILRYSVGLDLEQE
ncbi:MAG: dockerin type I repeat-containing protein [Clostridia bacterium]|nr:dockerin type I repeat-containing protein [Clostridia bacterium]MBR2413250.1 dockerin type I repeat-containing protein [Clostridia bacterium]